MLTGTSAKECKLDFVSKPFFLFSTNLDFYWKKEGLLKRREGRKGSRKGGKRKAGRKEGKVFMEGGGLIKNMQPLFCSR